MVALRRESMIRVNLSPVFGPGTVPALPELSIPSSRRSPFRSTSADPWTPLGRMLLDHLEGEVSAEAEIVWEDGARTPLPASLFFREPEDFPEVETATLALCRGHVLDVGAGAGSHALALQEIGLEVCGLDVCPGAVDVMRRRGVRRVRVGDVFRLNRERFDTLLLLMNGIGLVGSLDGLRRFLYRADQLLAPGGQILLDSSDLRLTDDLEELQRIVARLREGRYRGETRQRIVYRESVGAPLDWLFVDGDTLASFARRHHWRFQIVYEEGNGAYGARLVRC